MRFSIVTATFNSAKYLNDCLNSVAEQNYSDIEHIVIDGGSTDETLKLVKAAHSVSKCISESDNGIYDALKKGIKMATGDVIGFLHSDDQLGSSEIIKNIAELIEKTDADGVYGNLVFINIENKIVRTWQSSQFDRNNVKYGWMPPHPTLFLRKEVYQKHGLFDTSFKIAGDYDFMLRVMLDKDIKLAYHSEVITKMRIGGASNGNIKGITQKMKEDIRALKKNGFHFPLAVLIAKNFRKLPQLLKR